jgi:hypothetical protein
VEEDDVTNSVEVLIIACVMAMFFCAGLICGMWFAINDMGPAELIHAETLRQEGK